MTAIHFTVSTPVAPERIVRAFTDFTPQRLRTFPNIDPRYYQVYAVDDISAEVTEGSAFFGECGSALTTTGRNPVTSPSLLHHRMHLPRAASGAIALRRVKTGGAASISLCTAWART